MAIEDVVDHRPQAGDAAAHGLALDLERGDEVVGGDGNSGQGCGHGYEFLADRAGRGSRRRKDEAEDREGRR